MPSSSKNHGSSDKTSDELIKELLATIRNKDKTNEDEKDCKKHGRKHKRDKKKKHKHRSRSRERKSRKKSRSRSKEKTKSRKKRKQSSSPHKNEKSIKKCTDIEEEPKPSTSATNEIFSEVTIKYNDKLPVGANFRTVLEEVRKNEKVNPDRSPLDLPSLPCDPGKESHKQSLASFPICKDSIDKSEVFKKAIESSTDFIPRNVILKKDKDDDQDRISVQENDETKKSTTENKEFTNKDNIDDNDLTKVDEEMHISISKDEKNIFTKNNKEWEFSIKPLPGIEQSTEESKKKHGGKSKKDSKSRKRSYSPRYSRSRERKKKHRSNSRKRYKVKDHKRSSSRDRERISHNRNHRSRSRSRNRSFRKRSWSRGRRSRSRSYSGSRSEERIDKAKLLQIAKKRRAAGIFDIGDDNPKSVEDFVSYCEKLQRRQEREDRRTRGEIVSDDENDPVVSTFKHPYKPANDSIKINIMNSVPLPTKTTEESILDSAALRVVYPVSSGSIHRENTDWQKVEKEPVLLTCSIAQKNFRAMTTIEAEKIRQKAKQLQQTPAFLLPAPPAPPALPQQQIPVKVTAFDALLPPPPPTPATLLIPLEKEMIIKEPEDISAIPPRNVAEVLAKRAKAQRRLQEDPNDIDAMKELKLANDQMNTWAAYKNLPGKYTGTTGVDVLSAEQLQPHDPRGNAWVKKDMFKQLAPNFGGGIGLRLMQRMGWTPGTGLGREAAGNIEPLMLDVKNDRKGLATDEDLPARPKFIKNVPGTDLSGKHPVSLVMELCAKRKWAAPVFTCLESGPAHQREFIWKVVVNGIEYCSATSSKNKKDGKSVACQVVLQSMGLVPRDPSLPVII